MRLLFIAKALLLTARFSTLIANRDAIATMISAIKANRSSSTAEAEKIETPAQQTEPIPSFLPYNNAIQLLNPSSQYYYSDIYNPLATAVQIQNEQFAHHYKPVPNSGNRLSHYETDNSLKPSSKHFLIVSFIGLLLLFAIIQNTIISTKLKYPMVDVLSSRKRRDLISSRGLDAMTPEQKEIFNDDARVRCIQRMACLQNRKLLQDFGSAGKVLAKYLIRSMKTTVSESSGWNRLIEDAGIAGLRGDDCAILYRDCT